MTMVERLYKVKCLQCGKIYGTHFKDELQRGCRFCTGQLLLIQIKKYPTFPSSGKSRSYYAHKKWHQTTRRIKQQ